jgi:hypothetical protein
MLGALTDLPNFQSSHSLSNADYQFLADINGDGFITNADIQAMLNLVISLSTGSGSGSGGGGGSAANESTANDSTMPSLDSPGALADTVAGPMATTSKTTAAAKLNPLIGAFSGGFDREEPKAQHAAASRIAADSAPTMPSLPKAAVDHALFSSSMFRSRHRLGGHVAESTGEPCDIFFANQ